VDHFTLCPCHSSDHVAATEADTSAMSLYSLPFCPEFLEGPPNITAALTNHFCSSTGPVPLQVKVLSNSPEELAETAAQLEAALRCVCAGQVGRVLLLYRPSKKKLEKKKAQEAAAAAAARRSTFGGRGRGRGGSRGGRSGPGGRSGRSSPAFDRQFDFSSSRVRGGYEAGEDDGGYY
jgi:hypothetical protein